MSNPPAGWIPPQFREFIYAPLTEQEITDGINSMMIHDESGLRRPSRQEFLDSTGGHKVIGVKDTRTGKVRYNESENTFMEVHYFPEG